MKQQKDKGFTIIEVVLVLAIAGLIFLMVFIALPALQRSQRDTQRRHDLDRVQTAIQSYQTNNRNSIPAFMTGSSGSNAGSGGGSATDFIDRYMKAGGDTFQDPNGNDYTFNVGGNFDSEYKPDSAIIYVTHRAVCEGESLVSGQGNNKVALRYKLEGGGIACVNN